MLVRLLYASRARAPISNELVDSILARSRAHNRERGITGILCYADSVFVQVLEGGRREVSELYARIARDARHEDVQLLHFAEITERRFHCWTMGQVNLARVNPTLLLRYSPRASFDPFVMAGSATLALLEELIATAAIAERGP